MNKITTVVYAFLAILILACNEAPKEKTMKEQLAELNKSKIDLLMGATPKDFSTKTIDGTLFNSKDYKGKYWAIFVYDKNSLTKTESYDMVAELKQTHQLFGDKIPMIGIANGFSDDENALKAMFASAKFDFKQIDNTQGPAKESKVNDNVFCTPAKILIDPNGKVVYNGCGGKTETFNYKLDSLIKADKL
ncbi:peroxiredoxin family protein [Pedobacter jamesrossensis]|uniref:Peroxiredoxin family protein n=1 Tax=Pedobacter jamesrossensis TaxID=1908238 RepID=A0ABV8NHN5_9SPHI